MMALYFTVPTSRSSRSVGTQAPRRRGAARFARSLRSGRILDEEFLRSKTSGVALPGTLYPFLVQL